MPNRAFRVLPGRLEGEEEVQRALAAVVASPDQVGRHFTAHPLIDEAHDETYVIYKMWGLNTEPTLQALVHAFPDAGITFRHAED